VQRDQLGRRSRFFFVGFGLRHSVPVSRVGGSLSAGSSPAQLRAACDRPRFPSPDSLGTCTARVSGDDAALTRDARMPCEAFRARNTQAGAQLQPIVPLERAAVTLRIAVPPMQFGHFEFDPERDKLGEGPLSEVYKAVD